MVRYVVRAVVALVLAAPVVVVAPAEGAVAPPWTFAQAQAGTGNTIPAGSVEATSATCPGGYVLVGGGWAANFPNLLEVVAAYRESATTYTVLIRSYTSSLVINVHPVCALATQVGTITTVSTNLPWNPSTGVAGGTLNCPEGQVALFGGADWNAGGSTRRVDAMAPSANGRGWVVSAWTPIADELTVEAYCIASSNLGVSQPQVTLTPGDAGLLFNELLSCPLGQRAISAGAIASNGSGPDPTSSAFSVDASYVEFTPYWRIKGHTAFTYVGVYQAVWCVPASQPSVSFDAYPPERSNVTSFQFSYVTSDQMNETITATFCYLDDVQIFGGGCGTGKIPLAGLSAGPHKLVVTVQNASGQYNSVEHHWTVDLTPPAVSDIGTFTTLQSSTDILFSEQVTGVSAANVSVREIDTLTAVPGTLHVVGGDTATWTPAGPLVPGEKYEMVFGPGIADLAGNSLSPQTVALKAPVAVEATDPAVVEQWDLDKAKAAAGRSYATSRTKGASLTWRFTSGAGKRAVLYGVKSPQSGKAEIRVDGVKKATISLHAASLKHQQVLFTSAALSAGTHTVAVRVLGSKVRKSKGTWVGLDRLKVGTKNLQEKTARHRFRTVSDSNAFGGSFDSVDHATKGDTGGAPSYSLTFRGTEVHVAGPTTPSSGSVRIFVDGVLKSTVSLRSATVVHDYYASITGLTDAVHTLRIVPVGSGSGSGSSVAVDRIRVGLLN